MKISFGVDLLLLLCCYLGFTTCALVTDFTNPFGKTVKSDCYQTACNCSTVGDKQCLAVCNTADCDWDGNDCNCTAQPSTYELSFASNTPAGLQCADNANSFKYFDTKCSFNCGTSTAYYSSVSSCFTGSCSTSVNVNTLNDNVVAVEIVGNSVTTITFDDGSTLSCTPDAAKTCTDYTFCGLHVFSSAGAHSANATTTGATACTTFPNFMLRLRVSVLDSSKSQSETPTLTCKPNAQTTQHYWETQTYCAKSCTSSPSIGIAFAPYTSYSTGLMPPTFCTASSPHTSSCTTSYDCTSNSYAKALVNGQQAGKFYCVNGEWRAIPVQFCRPRCTNPPSLTGLGANVNIISSGCQNNDLGDKCYATTNYTCASNYQLMTDGYFTCDATGNWNANKQLCVQQCTTNPLVRDRMEQDPLSSCVTTPVNNGYVCNFTCKAGYRKDPLAYYYCNQGSWLLSVATPCLDSCKANLPITNMEWQLQINDSCPIPDGNYLPIICAHEGLAYSTSVSGLLCQDGTLRSLACTQVSVPCPVPTVDPETTSSVLQYSKTPCHENCQYPTAPSQDRIFYQPCDATTIPVTNFGSCVLKDNSYNSVWKWGSAPSTTLIRHGQICDVKCKSSSDSSYFTADYQPLHTALTYYVKSGSQGPLCINGTWEWRSRRGDRIDPTFCSEYTFKDASYQKMQLTAITSDSSLQTILNNKCEGSPAFTVDTQVVIVGLQQCLQNVDEGVAYQLSCKNNSYVVQGSSWIHCHNGLWRYESVESDLSSNVVFSVTNKCKIPDAVIPPAICNFDDSIEGVTPSQCRGIAAGAQCIPTCKTGYTLILPNVTDNSTFMNKKYVMRCNGATGKFENKILCVPICQGKYDVTPGGCRQASELCDYFCRRTSSNKDSADCSGPACGYDHGVCDTTLTSAITLKVTNVVVIFQVDRPLAPSAWVGLYKPGEMDAKQFVLASFVRNATLLLSGQMAVEFDLTANLANYSMIYGLTSWPNKLAHDLEARLFADGTTNYLVATSRMCNNLLGTCSVDSTSATSQFSLTAKKAYENYKWGISMAGKDMAVMGEEMNILSHNGKFNEEEWYYNFEKETPQSSSKFHPLDTPMVNRYHSVNGTKQYHELPPGCAESGCSCDKYGGTCDTECNNAACHYDAHSCHCGAISDTDFTSWGGKNISWVYCTNPYTGKGVAYGDTFYIGTICTFNCTGNKAILNGAMSPINMATCVADTSSNTLGGKWTSSVCVDRCYDPVTLPDNALNFNCANMASGATCSTFDCEPGYHKGTGILTCTNTGDPAAGYGGWTRNSALCVADTVVNPVNIPCNTPDTNTGLPGTNAKVQANACSNANYPDASTCPSAAVCQDANTYIWNDGTSGSTAKTIVCKSSSVATVAGTWSISGGFYCLPKCLDSQDTSRPTSSTCAAITASTFLNPGDSCIIGCTNNYKIWNCAATEICTNTGLSSSALTRPKSEYNYNGVTIFETDTYPKCYKDCDCSTIANGNQYIKCGSGADGQTLTADSSTSYSHGSQASLRCVNVGDGKVNNTMITTGTVAPYCDNGNWVDYDLKGMSSSRFNCEVKSTTVPPPTYGTFYPNNCYADDLATLAYNQILGSAGYAQISSFNKTECKYLYSNGDFLNAVCYPYSEDIIQVTCNTQIVNASKGAWVTSGDCYKRCPTLLPSFDRSVNPLSGIVGGNTPLINATISCNTADSHPKIGSLCTITCPSGYHVEYDYDDTSYTTNPQNGYFFRGAFCDADMKWKNVPACIRDCTCKTCPWVCPTTMRDLGHQPCFAPSCNICDPPKNSMIGIYPTGLTLSYSSSIALTRNAWIGVYNSTTADIHDWDYLAQYLQPGVQATISKLITTDAQVRVYYDYSQTEISRLSICQVLQSQTAAASCVTATSPSVYSPVVKTPTNVSDACLKKGCLCSIYGDGVCDPQCNYAECQWDGGDCGCNPPDGLTILRMASHNCGTKTSPFSTCDITCKDNGYWTTGSVATSSQTGTLTCTQTTTNTGGRWIYSGSCKNSCMTPIYLNISHGSYLGTCVGTKHGQECPFTCDQNYSPYTGYTTVCEDGKWAPKAMCIPHCNTSNITWAIPNGYWTFTNNSMFAIGSSLTDFACFSGYQKSGQVTCTPQPEQFCEPSIWTTNVACVKIPDPVTYLNCTNSTLKVKYGLGAPAASCPGVTLHQGTCDLVCQDSYIATGTNPAVCNNGNWVVNIGCAAPCSVYPHRRADSSSSCVATTSLVSTGSTCSSWQCLDSYTIQSSCPTAPGFTDSTKPLCTRKSSAAMTLWDEGYTNTVWNNIPWCFSYCTVQDLWYYSAETTMSCGTDKVLHGGQCFIQCQKGYKLIGGNPLCYDGHFLPYRQEVHGKCIPEAPQLPSPVTYCAYNKITSPSYSTLTGPDLASCTATAPHGTEVAFTCNTDYTLVGTGTVLCNQGLWQWRGECVPVNYCSQLSIVNSVSGCAKTTDGGSCTVSCQTGYVLSWYNGSYGIWDNEGKADKRAWGAICQGTQWFNVPMCIEKCKVASQCTEDMALCDKVCAEVDGSINCGGPSCDNDNGACLATQGSFGAVDITGVRFSFKTDRRLGQSAWVGIFNTLDKTNYKALARKSVGPTSNLNFTGGVITFIPGDMKGFLERDGFVTVDRQNRSHDYEIRLFADAGNSVVVAQQTLIWTLVDQMANEMAPFGTTTACKNVNNTYVTSRTYKVNYATTSLFGSDVQTTFRTKIANIMNTTSIVLNSVEIVSATQIAGGYAVAFRFVNILSKEVKDYLSALQAGCNLDEAFTSSVTVGDSVNPLVDSTFVPFTCPSASGCTGTVSTITMQVRSSTLAYTDLTTSSVQRTALRTAIASQVGLSVVNVEIITVGTASPFEIQFRLINIPCSSVSSAVSTLQTAVTTSKIANLDTAFTTMNSINFNENTTYTPVSCVTCSVGNGLETLPAGTGKACDAVNATAVSSQFLVVQHGVTKLSFDATVRDTFRKAIADAIGSPLTKNNVEIIYITENSIPEPTYVYFRLLNLYCKNVTSYIQKLNAAVTAGTTSDNQILAQTLSSMNATNLDDATTITPLYCPANATDVTGCNNVIKQTGGEITNLGTTSACNKVNSSVVTTQTVSVKSSKSASELKSPDIQTAFRENIAKGIPGILANQVEIVSIASSTSTSIQRRRLLAEGSVIYFRIINVKCSDANTVVSGVTAALSSSNITTLTGVIPSTVAQMNSSNPGVDSTLIPIACENLGLCTGDMVDAVWKRATIACAVLFAITFVCLIATIILLIKKSNQVSSCTEKSTTVQPVRGHVP